eukprot:Gregarina_sp_Pseudo_9__2989@NODE_31_length_5552_cov_77_542899_g29_i0_p1_GENE_NODE_31_length_5552_cov_77_542899_g29_i0NODE_31_length_5552_cov_77_542899_g29_i0_p1_ORF_typecomplete_len793_score260_22_NODE_31_length_5552_cov_77_542899_g29_i0762454
MSEAKSSAPRIQLPEGAIAVRTHQAEDCPTSQPPAAWTEIELHTPTADQNVVLRPPGFTPAPGIPENATAFASVISPDTSAEPAARSAELLSKSPPAMNPEMSEGAESSPLPVAGVQSTPPSCVTLNANSDQTSNNPVSGGGVPAVAPARMNLFRETSLGTMFLGRDPDNDALLCRDIEASTCRIPLNPFEHDSQHKTFPSPQPETRSFTHTVTRQTSDNAAPLPVTDFSAMMRTRTFSPSWKKNRPPKMGWSAASLEATNSLPQAHPSTTTQTSLLDVVPSLDTAECQLEEGVSARDVKLAGGFESSRGPPDEEEDLGQTKGLKAALCSFLAGLHPLYLIYLSRALFSLPLSVVFLALALASPDWRHVSLSYMGDHKVNSRTIIGLTAIERSTETQSSVLPAAATVRELPLSYKQILSHAHEEKYCDEAAQTQAAEAAIGTLTVKEALAANEVAGPDSQRARKLALYHLIHGPTFRDVDCRHIRAFRAAGIATKVLVAFVLVLLVGEWWIIGFTLLTKKRTSEAKGALQWSLVQRHARRGRRHTRAETDPAQYLDTSPSPPFVWPKRPPLSSTTLGGDRDISNSWHREPSWAMIDLRRHSLEAAARTRTHSHTVREPHGLVFSRMRQSLKRVRQRRLRGKRAGRSLLASCRRKRDGASGGRVCLLGRRRVTHLKFTRVSDRLWWRPVRKLEGWLRWSPGRTYFSASLLGGSTLALCVLQTVFLTLAAVVWMTKTSKPACLDEETDLNTCAGGRGVSFLFVGLALSWLALYCHLKTPSFCLKVFQAKLSSYR